MNNTFLTNIENKQDNIIISKQHHSTNQRIFQLKKELKKLISSMPEYQYCYQASINLALPQSILSFLFLQNKIDKQQNQKLLSITLIQLKNINRQARKLKYSCVKDKQKIINNPKSCDNKKSMIQLKQTDNTEIQKKSILFNLICQQLKRRQIKKKIANTERQDKKNKLLKKRIQTANSHNKRVLNVYQGLKQKQTKYYDDLFSLKKQQKKQEHKQILIKTINNDNQNKKFQKIKNQQYKQQQQQQFVKFVYNTNDIQIPFHSYQTLKNLKLRIQYKGYHKKRSNKLNKNQNESKHMKIYKKKLQIIRKQQQQILKKYIQKQIKHKNNKQSTLQTRQLQQSKPSVFQPKQQKIQNRQKSILFIDRSEEVIKNKQNILQFRSTNLSNKIRQKHEKCRQKKHQIDHLYLDKTNSWMKAMKQNNDLLNMKKELKQRHHQAIIKNRLKQSESLQQLNLKINKIKKLTDQQLKRYIYVYSDKFKNQNDFKL